MLLRLRSDGANRGNSPGMRQIFESGSHRRRGGGTISAVLLSLALCRCGDSGSQPKVGSEGTPKSIVAEASATVDSEGRPLGKEALSLANGLIRIWYADLGDSLAIRVVAREAVVVHVDMNQNGIVDRLADVKFGALDDGSLCAEFEHDKGEEPRCNEVPSQAKSLVRPIGDELDTLWKIPKAELGRGTRGANVSLELFNTDSQKSTFLPAPPFSQVYAFKFGRAAAVEGASTAAEVVPQPRPGTPMPAMPVPSKMKNTTAPAQPPPAPVISWFTADPNPVAAGAPVRLAWSVAGGDVRIEPGIGAVTPVDQRDEHPVSTTNYTLTAVGPGGAVTRNVKVEVVEPVEITRFFPEKPVVFLDDTIVLFWQTRGATEVTLALISAPDGSRFKYPATPQPTSGSLSFPVAPGEFTRFGNYEFQLIAKATSGPYAKSPASKPVKVFLRQR